MDFNWKQRSAHKVDYGEKNSPVYQYHYHYYRDRYLHPIAYRAILILRKNLSSNTVYFKCYASAYDNFLDQNKTESWW